ncbi:DUF3644 domain-containing protein [Vibrio cholerae]|uniref:DUF3644 domain-containing protein n=2 Tax=Vibrio cholerae TaxID=666 RepID=UPI0018F0B040|nr:DUF3644 domain-containing protein [Vibrio cholerae]MBJ6977078.1 DUF3644 domain-containing protein [Vibrio cholerae]HDZ9245429.1 DUF3644 domain-containing protein [Vibrio cholerae]HDZ9485673.1 DUF3644 domain-containing protein [Vibrio cholerae]
MVRQDKRILLLEFFREQENKSASFTFQQAADATGYNPKSVGKYISEKLNGTYIFKSDKGGWVSEGLSQVSNDDFIRLMSQSTSARKLTPNEKMYQKLIKRSLDAFILALEVYNRPSLSNRVEAFTIMMVNAWELFLKAEILDALGSEKVFYKNGRSISISDALPLRLQNNDPVRLNIETLIQLRDQATHLLIPELQPQLSRLFQANVLNYQERYRNQMGNSPLAGQSVGMLSLVLDGPEPEIGVIKECYGDITASEVASFLKQFETNAKEINSDKYSISIEYKLALTKNPSNADLTLSVGYNGQQAVIITQAKDLNTTHPHTTNEAINKINSILGSKKINRHSFQAICYKHKIKQDNNSTHHNFTDIHRYSEAFVTWVVKNITEQKGWLESALECYKNRK